jgi:hypothetical protein
VSLLFFSWSCWRSTQPTTKKTWISHWENKKHQQIMLCLCWFSMDFLQVEPPSESHLHSRTVLKSSPFVRV